MQLNPLRALALALPMAVIGAPVVAAQGDSHQVCQAPGLAASDARAQVRQMNADASTPFIGDGAKGPAVLRAQVLLDRHWFSPGQIDGRYGRNTRHAILNFQRSRGLSTTGTLDQRTWQALSDGQQPAFTTYQLTQDDVNGPYKKIPDDPHEMAKMDRLYYESLLEALSERFHVEPELLQACNAGRSFQAGQAIVVPRVGEKVALPEGDKSITISKSERMLYLKAKDGKVLAAFPISIGGSGNEIPVGRDMEIDSNVKNPNFRYDADLLKGYSNPEPAVVPPGPNSPVGLVWMGLSEPHWGIHGTSEPSEMARVQTNGCIRMTNWDVLRLREQVGIGTTVHMAQ